MGRYRTLPVTIEAHQFLPDVGRIPAGVIQNHHFPSGWGIETNGGWVGITPGCMVITGVNGEISLCDLEIFNEIYEVAE